MSPIGKKRISIALIVVLALASASTAWSMAILPAHGGGENHLATSLPHHLKHNSAEGAMVPMVDAAHEHDGTHLSDDCSSCAHCVALLPVIDSMVVSPSPLQPDECAVSHIAVFTPHFRPPRSII